MELVGDTVQVSQVLQHQTGKTIILEFALCTRGVDTGNTNCLDCDTSLHVAALRFILTGTKPNQVHTLLSIWYE